MFILLKSMLVRVPMRNLRKALFSLFSLRSAGLDSNTPTKLSQRSSVERKRMREVIRTCGRRSASMRGLAAEPLCSRVDEVAGNQCRASFYGMALTADQLQHWCASGTASSSLRGCQDKGWGASLLHWLHKEKAQPGSQDQLCAALADPRHPQEDDEASTRCRTC